ncbi:MAG: Gfo/Idh/MocA family oxidoreductase, partial [Flammeovirgaceae bacterium]|nr:Gfo/Idh/MocA family oxidoreductase [Flammeovirgaceae bacterium]
VGSGWWGMNILSVAIKAQNVKVVALVDVDANQLNDANTKVGKLCNDQPKLYGDYREMLEKEKPEIVINATPDHWHALVTIDAVNSGAHVYVEKPIGHTINEGKAMIKAARENDKMVQVGLHRHISPHNMAGIEFLKSGRAGDIGMIRSFVHYGYQEPKIVVGSEPPKGLDWDMWCGPAPLDAYNPKIHPKGFRNFLNFANGTAGDWGVHWFDQILWWTEENYPKKVFSTGGKNIVKDNTNAPDHQVINFEFESFTATWEHRKFGANNAENHNIGCYFYGTKGTFHMGWMDGWTFYPNDKKGEIIHMDHSMHKPDWQNIPELWDDFIKSIETNKLPVADIQQGHYATNMSLLGMLSYKLGRSVEWDGEKELIVGDNEANKLLSREYRGPWKYPV